MVGTRKLATSDRQSGAGRAVYAVGRDGSRLAYVNFPFSRWPPERLLEFQYYWEAAAKPFEWKFTRQDLNDLHNELNAGSTKVE